MRDLRAAARIRDGEAFVADIGKVLKAPVRNERCQVRPEEAGDRTRRILDRDRRQLTVYDILPEVALGERSGGAVVRQNIARKAQIA